MKKTSLIIVGLIVMASVLWAGGSAEKKPADWPEKSKQM